MSIDTQKTVAEIAQERPQAAATFEKPGIDYCCGGGKPLAAACEAAGIDVNPVADLLEETPEGISRTPESPVPPASKSPQSVRQKISFSSRQNPPFTRSRFCLKLTFPLAQKTEVISFLHFAARCAKQTDAKSIKRLFS